MKLKVWIKSSVADRFLAPLRKELLMLIDQDASVLEIGCGTGDLLFRSASKINHGMGIDLDRDLIDHADRKRQEKGLKHLHFTCADALEMEFSGYDIATSTLCLHTLPEQDACNLLQLMVQLSGKVIIADYREAGSLTGKLAIELDELISGHYRNFKRYRRIGEIPSYANKVGARIDKEVASSIDGISIWLIEGKRDSMGLQEHRQAKRSS